MRVEIILLAQKALVEIKKINKMCMLFKDRVLDWLQIWMATSPRDVIKAFLHNKYLNRIALNDFKLAPELFYIPIQNQLKMVLGKYLYHSKNIILSTIHRGLVPF